VEEYKLVVDYKNETTFIENFNKILECAIEGNADYIVTGDKHLLDIKEYSGIKIVKANEILTLL
jgi:predicted nucleic acid-binding protein